MNDTRVESWLANYAKQGMEAAIVVNALRGERRLGPYQRFVVHTAMLNYQRMVVEAADSIIRHRELLLK